ncbi:unnamed protein product [Schistosoma mattheei]|uniref:Uncharacterized protein n=1 Tax=Schistosoma mattheei TaxID=31246 RepID=A0A3P8G3C9_9TREM|nr:unnamed protein product [Schistosoma mattheei]
MIILNVQLEYLELNLWKSQMESMAKKPITVYNDFLQSLSSLPISVLSDNTVADTLNTKTRCWLNLIEKSYNRRAKALEVQSKSKFFRRIKLSDRNLKASSELAKCFYELRILPRIHLLERRIDDWWSEFQLDENDFTGASFIDVFNNRSTVTGLEVPSPIAYSDSGTFILLDIRIIYESDVSILCYPVRF